MDGIRVTQEQLPKVRCRLLKPSPENESFNTTRPWDNKNAFAFFAPFAFFAAKKRGNIQANKYVQGWTYMRAYIYKHRNMTHIHVIASAVK